MQSVLLAGRPSRPATGPPTRRGPDGRSCDVSVASGVRPWRCQMDVKRTLLPCGINTSTRGRSQVPAVGQDVWMLSRASKSTKLRGSVDGLDRLDTLDVVTGVVTPGPHRPYGRMSAAGQISANVSHSGPETSNESAPTLASRSALVCQAARRPGTPVHRWVRSASHRFSRCPAAEAAGGSCLAPGASLPVAPAAIDSCSASVTRVWASQSGNPRRLSGIGK